MKYRTECPKCGANERKFSRCFMHPHGGNQMERLVTCLDCGHSWLEIYDLELARIIDNKPKESDKCSNSK